MPKVAVIIGAGPAGLTAAYELLTTTEYVPIIIEADKQVGGLSKTVDYKGNKMDIGGHRFFSKSKKVIDWWLHFMPLQQEPGQEKVKIYYHNKETEVSTIHATTRSTGLMLLRSRKSRILFRKNFLDYPLRLSLETIKNLGPAKFIHAGFSYALARLFPIRNEKNLAQFFTNRFGKELYVTFFKEYTEKVWGVSCEDIPAEWGKQRVKDLDIGKVLKHAFKTLLSKDKSLAQPDTSTSLIEQFLYPMQGPGQMWETVTNEILKLGGKLLLNNEVVAINYDNNKTIVSVTIKDLISTNQSIITGDVFFSTMPVRDLILTSNKIEIPGNIVTIAKGLQYRDFLIVGLLLNKLLLKDKDSKKMITDNWIYLQDFGIKAGRVQIFNNWSPFMTKDPDNAWIGVEYFCSHDEEFWQQSDKQVIAQAIEEMKQIGFINPADVKDAVVVKVLKAYPSYIGTYNRFDEIRMFLDTIRNLYCIGRNGMHKYNNSDHSMLTAMEAVINLKNKDVTRNEIWAVNTEEYYHEERK